MKKFNTSNPLPYRLRTLFLVVIMVLVAGCNALRFAYDHGDTALYWWVDSYFDLEGEQGDMVKRDIDNLFQWHRQTQLQDYAALLGTFQRQLGGNVTQADLIADAREIQKRVELLGMRAAPDMADLALSLTPAQIANLERKFTSKNEEFRHKNLRGDLEKRQRVRFKKSMEQFESWFGNFSIEQKKIMRQASDARPMDDEVLLEERIYRQRLILALLREFQQEKPSKEQATEQIRSLLRGFSQRMESPERKAFFDANLDGNAKYILTALQSATPAQKAHAQKRMQGWIGDLNTLAANR